MADTNTKKPNCEMASLISYQTTDKKEDALKVSKKL
jgi:hypothetical protein